MSIKKPNLKALAGILALAALPSVAHAETGQYPNTWDDVTTGGTFSIIQATSGIDWVSPAVADQKAQSIAQGKTTIGYEHEAIPNASNGRAQATFFLDSVTKVAGVQNTSNLALSVKLEANQIYTNGNACYDMTPAQLVQWESDFSAKIREVTGTLPIIHTNPTWWTYCQGTENRTAANPLWVSAVTPTTFAGWSKISLHNLPSATTVTSDVPVADLKIRPTTKAEIPNSTYVVTGSAVDGKAKLYDANGVFVKDLPLPARYNPTMAVSVHVADLNGDKIQDVVTQLKSGQLVSNLGLATGGFAAPTTLGYGWAGNDISIGYWKKGDTLPTIGAVNSKGQYLTYSFVKNSNGTVRVDYQGIKGYGWNNFHPQFVDVNNDGFQEVVGLHPTSKSLVRYNRNADGSWVNETRPILGTNLGNVNAMGAYNGNALLLKNRVTGIAYKYTFNKTDGTFVSSVFTPSGSQMLLQNAENF